MNRDKRHQALKGRDICGPVCLLIIGIVATACGNDQASVSATRVTFWKDVHPILQARCVACHRVGGIAPMNFDAATGDRPTDDGVAEEVAALAGQIDDAVARGVMPPWPATALTPPTREHDPVLEDERAILAAWRDARAPVGDPADAPAIPAREPFPITTPPDLVLNTGVDYTPPAGERDDHYRCFAAPMSLPSDRMLIGWRYVPGVPEQVHHAILTLVDGADLGKLQQLDDQTTEPGWPCSGAGVDGAIARTVGRIGTFTPGKDGQVFFPGTAARVPSGSVVLFSIHYNTSHVPRPRPDRSTVELFFAPPGGPRLERLGQISTTTREIEIPANAASTTVVNEVVVGESGTGALADGERFLVGAFLHMHQLAVRARITLNKGLASERVLLDIEPWRFAWQFDYTYVEPIAVRTGDTLTQECTYDNSREHRLAEGLEPTSIEVRYGERSTDEMCLGTLFAIDNLP